MHVNLVRLIIIDEIGQVIASNSLVIASNSLLNLLPHGVEFYPKFPGKS